MAHIQYGHTEIFVPEIYGLNHWFFNGSHSLPSDGQWSSLFIRQMHIVWKKVKMSWTSVGQKKWNEVHFMFSYVHPFIHSTVSMPVCVCVCVQWSNSLAGCLFSPSQYSEMLVGEWTPSVSFKHTDRQRQEQNLLPSTLTLQMQKPRENMEM